LGHISSILAGLLIPAVLFGKFKARVTTCTNNYRQLTVAAALCAGNDSRGRSLSFELPTISSVWTERTAVASQLAARRLAPE
jgi:hypothetical protein